MSKDEGLSSRSDALRKLSADASKGEWERDSSREYVREEREHRYEHFIMDGNGKRILDANNSENAEMEQEDGVWSDKQARADMGFVAALVNAYRAGELVAPLSERRQSEPPPGLLVSIALRLDHGLFMPQLGEDEEGHKRRIEVTLSDARRAWEECSGNGFYSPEREAGYVAMQEKGVSPMELFQIARPSERK